jgi:MoxR-like ATPase
MSHVPMQQQIPSLTHRAAVQVIRTIYPGGCGFDYKRASVSALHEFLLRVLATYPENVAAALAAVQPSATPPAAVPPPPVATAVPAPSLLAPAVQAPAPQPVVPSAPAESPAAEAEACPQVVQASAPAPAEDDDAPAAIIHTSPSPSSTDTPYTLESAAVLFPKVRWPEGFEAASLTLRHYHSEDAPQVDPSYIFQPEALALALVCIANDVTMPLWCYGEKGTGKTEFCRNIAGRLGRPFYRIQCDRNLERAEFIGARGLRAGETAWQDGTLMLGVRRPGAFILFDEPTYLQQGNVSVLNGVLEMRAPRDYRIADTGELVTFAPDVCFFAADNTNGQGDESGRYIGTGPMNAATLERFAFFVRFDYLSKDAEARLLRVRTGAPKETCRLVSSIMDVCRAKCASGHLPDAPSVRAAVYFLRAVLSGVRPQDAYEGSVVGRAAPEAKEELRAIFASHWPATFDARTGTTPTAAPAVQSNAPDAFDSFGEKF